MYKVKERERERDITRAIERERERAVEKEQDENKHEDRTAEQLGEATQNTNAMDEYLQSERDCTTHNISSGGGRKGERAR